MKHQDYGNHRQFYPPHHFIFYPLALIGMGIGSYLAYSKPEQRLEWIAITILTVLVTWVSFMLRQHYALGNQNRIVRLEMRLRYHQLTGKRLELLEDSLTFGQIAALRFASDEELLPLLERTLNEQLSPDAIKKSIRNWQADWMRV